MAYDIAWDVVEASLPIVARGMLDTIVLASASFVAGLGLGVGAAAILVSRWRGARAVVAGYVEVVRNTPMLVQLYFLFYGLPQVGVRMGSNTTAWVALSLYCAAYVAEIIRANLETIGRGQVEAARALGMREFAVFQSVVMPQAMRGALPALGGQAIVMLKLSSLASVIGAVELTYRVVDVVAQTYRSLELYAMAGLAYLAMTLCAAWGARALERRMRVGARAG